MATIFILLLSAVVVGAQENCRPKIWSRKYPLYIYKESTSHVKVYNCRYEETRKYENGKPDDIKTYDDFTYGCVNASKTGYFKDKYGFPYENLRLNQTLTTFYSYSQYQYDKYIRITIREFNVEADFTRGIIFLPSGTVCKYSRGFCYDRNSKQDFAWEVEEKKELDCHKLQKYALAEDSFFLQVKQLYLVSEVDQGLAVLELLDEEEYMVCNLSVWKTKNYGTYVSSWNISLPTPLRPVGREEYAAYFDEKEDMYNFLTKRCENKVSLTLEDSIEARMTIAQLTREQISLDVKSLGILRKEVEILQARLLLVVVSCGVCAAICVLYLVYRVVKGNSSIIVRRLRGRRQIRSATKVIGGNEIEVYGNHYEDITSQYDINSVYSK